MQQNKILHHNTKLVSLLRIISVIISMYSQNIHCDMLVILKWQLISKANFDNLICLNLQNWLRYYFHEKVRQILHLCHCYLLKGLWFAFCGWFSALRKSYCNSIVSQADRIINRVQPEQFENLQFLNDEIDQITNFAKLPSANFLFSNNLDVISKLLW